MRMRTVDSTGSWYGMHQGMLQVLCGHKHVDIVWCRHVVVTGDRTCLITAWIS